MPLFASLGDDQARACSLSAREHHADAGEAIVEQWQVSRDLYVVLTGDGAGHRGRPDLAARPGRFFGELAAIDWGAGFGRTRTATVTATEPTPAARPRLDAREPADEGRPGFGERLEEASRERLATL